jgi:hypothetical protein
LRRIVARTKRLPLIAERSVDGPEDAIGLPIGGIPLKRRLGRLQAFARAILACVDTGELGAKLRRIWRERDRLFQGIDRLIDFLVVFEMAGEEKVIAGAGPEA